MIDPIPMISTIFLDELAGATHRPGFVVDPPHDSRSLSRAISQ
jgi:hypothetical protein